MLIKRFNKMFKNLKTYKLPFVNLIAIIITSTALISVIVRPRLINDIPSISGPHIDLVINVDVRGTPIVSQSMFIQKAMKNKEVSVLVRNQHAGRLNLVHIHRIYNNPNPNHRSQYPSALDYEVLNIRFTLQGKAYRSQQGLVIAGKNIKIGSPIVIEGDLFRFNGIVTDLKIK